MVREMRDATANDDGSFAGKTLLDMEADDYSDPSTLAEAKRLTRQLLQHHLAGQVLETRRLVLDLQALESRSHEGPPNEAATAQVDGP